MHSGGAEEQARMLAAVRAVMLRHGLEGAAVRADVVHDIVDTVQAVARGAGGRRIADRRDPEAYRDLVGNPLWRADAAANWRDYERRQGERRQGERRASEREE